jgi:hypothetical protein
VYTFNYKCFIALLLFVPTIRPVDLYTWRGLRFKKCGVRRRFGKVLQTVVI